MRKFCHSLLRNAIKLAIGAWLLWMTIVEDGSSHGGNKGTCYSIELIPGLHLETASFRKAYIIEYKSISGDGSLFLIDKTSQLFHMYVDKQAPCYMHMHAP